MQSKKRTISWKRDRSCRSPNNNIWATSTWCRHLHLPEMVHVRTITSKHREPKCSVRIMASGMKNGEISFYLRRRPTLNCRWVSIQGRAPNKGPFLRHTDKGRWEIKGTTAQYWPNTVHLTLSMIRNLAPILWTLMTTMKKLQLSKYSQVARTRSTQGSTLTSEINSLFWTLTGPVTISWKSLASCWRPAANIKLSTTLVKVKLAFSIRKIAEVSLHASLPSGRWSKTFFQLMNECQSISKKLRSRIGLSRRQKLNGRRTFTNTILISATMKSLGLILALLRWIFLS